jgi:hypothetical protein
MKLKRQSSLDDDIKPEYDFSHGERGRYAHLFGESATDEALVAEFWKEKGFDAQRFEKAETRFSKTPDFKLYRDERLVAFCEVKTFQHDSWLDRKLKNAASGELAGGLRPDPIYNRISNAVHAAIQQLETANPKHEYLNFLALVNRDMTATCEDLTSVLTGYWDPLHGVLEKTSTAYSEGRIREGKRKIDLYVWLEPSQNKPLKPRLFFFGNENDETRDRICKMLGVNPNKFKGIR